MSKPDPPDDDTRARPKKPGSGAGTGAWVPAGLAPVVSAIPERLGRFELRAVLGEGAFGRVYLGFDSRLARQVAIKVPRPEGLTAEFRERFLREARATATIHHPNVCPVHEVGVVGEFPYIVMHYVAGTTLAAVLDRLNGPLPPRHALAVARKLALGIGAAHARGVTHRDLKPANVLYDPATREVLITDFGLALLADESRRTAEGAVFGTPAYMSPEQARGKVAEVGPHSDIYSLGVVLYRMLTGDVPFHGSVFEVMMQHAEVAPRRPSALNPALDPALDAVCLTAMAKKPKDRFHSAKVFADALTELLRTDGRSESDAELPFATIFRNPKLPLAEDVPPNRPVAHEIVRCPRCDARLQIAQGRTEPVDCQRCDCKFAVAAGRQAAGRYAEPVQVTPVEPAPPARAQTVKPKPLPPAPKEPDVPPRRSGRRVLALLCLLLLAGTGGAAWWYWSEIESALADAHQRLTAKTPAEPPEPAKPAEKAPEPKPKDTGPKKQSEAKPPEPKFDAKKLIGVWERTQPTTPSLLWEFTSDGKRYVGSTAKSGSGYPYSLDGDLLTITYSTTKTVYTLTKLTDDELHVKFLSTPYVFKQVKPSEPGDVVEVEVATGAKMKFCWIPGGQCQLGSRRPERMEVLKQFKNPADVGWLDSESEETRGTFKTSGFWLGKYEVTQEEWRAVMGGKNPSFFSADGQGRNLVRGMDTNRFPVDQVSWDDCQEFLTKLNEKARRPGAMRKGKFVLPLATEWEYACRGGKSNTQAFYFGTSLNGTQANCNGTIPFGTTLKGPNLQRTERVGSYELRAKHPWGLCDTSGNLWEWCGIKGAISFCGGSWSNECHCGRAAARAANGPAYRANDVGFRVCFRPD